MKRNVSKREAVLDAALKLFNQAGTPSVTTNHIARSAEISPGNLYYHFRNKEEIIRELYGRFCNDYGVIWERLFESEFSAQAITDTVVNGFEINAKYRFIALELASLCHRDSILMAQQREKHAERFELIRTAIDRYVTAGIFTVSTDDTLYEDVQHLVWLINQYWLSYVYLRTDEPDQAELQRGVRLAFRVIEPHFTKSWRRKMAIQP
jgi:AcrR family transcriptional regulator